MTSLTSRSTGTAPTGPAALQGEGGAARPRRATAPPAVVMGCLVYTAERGWHFGTVDVAEILRCDTEGGSRINDDRTARHRRSPQVKQADHGTRSAWARHRRHGETPCGACSEANRLYQRAYKRARLGIDPARFRTAS